VWVSGLIMPAWAVISLGVLWAIAVVVAIRWRRQPGLVVIVPLALLAIWFLTAWIGDTFWGWTA
jgi:hypothetical protein